MRKTGKRALVLGLALAMILTLFAGCGNDRGKDESISAMADSWFAYLQHNEQIWSAMLWAYDYADTFCAENDWESLLTARAAASASLMTVKDLALPVCTLTQDQCSELMGREIEADVVLMEFESAEATHQSRVDTLTLLNTHLKNDVFFTADMDMIRAWLDSSRQCLELEAGYLWASTNYLLLQMDRKELWQQWQTELPTLASYGGGWTEDADYLMERTGKLLDDLADELIRYSGYLGTSEYTYQLVEDTIASLDFTAMTAALNDISGVDAYFPAPAWLPEVLPLYFVNDPDTQEARMITAGQELTQAPTSCYITLSGIARTDVEEYAQNLESWGISAQSQWEEDTQTLRVFAASGDCSMLMEWNREETVIFLTEPVGCLIPELYLLAMMVE